MISKKSTRRTRLTCTPSEEVRGINLIESTLLTEEAPAEAVENRTARRRARVMYEYIYTSTTRTRNRNDAPRIANVQCIYSTVHVQRGVTRSEGTVR